MRLRRFAPDSESVSPATSPRTCTPQRAHRADALHALATGRPARRIASSRVVPAGTRTLRPEGENRMHTFTAASVAFDPAHALGYPARMPTAGILVIGNEILSGKVEDTNSPYLARELRALGVDLQRILVIPDDVEIIAHETRTMSDAYDHVFTSGGIGPTHDDLTMDGIAAAFGVPIERSESIVNRLHRAIGSDLNDSQLKMAQVPKGAQLLDVGDLWFPVVIVENVHIFPGIPELLRKKFESIRARFRGVPVLLKRVYVKLRESDIAHSLNELLEEFPELMLGSYPKIGVEAFHVLLTLESRDAGYLQNALDSLLERLPADSIHKVE